MLVGKSSLTKVFFGCEQDLEHCVTNDHTHFPTADSIFAANNMKAAGARALADVLKGNVKMREVHVGCELFFEPLVDTLHRCTAG